MTVAASFGESESRGDSTEEILQKYIGFYATETDLIRELLYKSRSLHQNKRDSPDATYVKGVM